MDRSSQVPKSLARIQTGRVPRFTDVVNVARVGAAHDLTIAVLCLRQTDLRRWQRIAAGSATLDQQLSIMDLNRHTAAELCETLTEEPSHLTILAGFHRALARGSIAPAYVVDLLDAVHGGTVLLA